MSLRWARVTKTPPTDLSEIPGTWILFRAVPVAALGRLWPREWCPPRLVPTPGAQFASPRAFAVSLESIPRTAGSVAMGLSLMLQVLTKQALWQQQLKTAL